MSTLSKHTHDCILAPAFEQLTVALKTRTMFLLSQTDNDNYQTNKLCICSARTIHTIYQRHAASTQATLEEQHSSSYTIRQIRQPNKSQHFLLSQTSTFELKQRNRKPLGRCIRSAKRRRTFTRREVVRLKIR